MANKPLVYGKKERILKKNGKMHLQVKKNA
jgi:hypothetical protein